MQLHPSLTLLSKLSTCALAFAALTLTAMADDTPMAALVPSMPEVPAAVAETTEAAPTSAAIEIQPVQTQANVNAVLNEPDLTPTQQLKLVETLDYLYKIEENPAKDVKLRAAQVAAKARDFKQAEKLYLEALQRPLSEEEHFHALLELASVYTQAAEWTTEMVNREEFQAIFGEGGYARSQGRGPLAHYVRALSVYEKFLYNYPTSELAPHLNLQLGHLYRATGAHRAALDSFYAVLNTAIKLSSANIPAYKKTTLEARKGIAQTYFLMADWENAASFFNRLRLLDVDPGTYQEALFKVAYAQHQLGQRQRALTQLEQFVGEFPASPLSPEAHYLRAQIYDDMGQPQRAVDAVMELLAHDSVQNAQDKNIWAYWQKKAANEMANAYYEAGDLISALRLYQNLFKLERSLSWRTPVMYQIGLCFERLGQLQRAADAFEATANNKLADNGSAAPGEITQPVRLVQDLARFRLGHVQWSLSAEKRMRTLAGLAQQGAGTEGEQ